MPCIAPGSDAQARGQAVHPAEIQERLGRLTPRESEILDLIVAGRNKVTALDLGISQSTAEAHRAEVMEKPGPVAVGPDAHRPIECQGTGRLQRDVSTAWSRGNPACG